MSCCGGSESGAGQMPDQLQEQFLAFLGATASPGALDQKTKQAIAIALSVLAKCEPCLKSHIQKARKTGFTQAEIDEAAWMAVGFGGCPVMMMYKKVSREA